MGRTADSTPTVALPPRPRRAGALVVDLPLVVDALAALAAAESPSGAAEAVLGPLARLDGVRGGAVVRAARPGTDAVLLASTGDDWSSTGPGTRLSRDAGMPGTECVRTGTVQVAGEGPPWVAVPAGPGTALLLSLAVPAPGEADLARLVRLGAVLGSTLVRAGRAEGLRTDLAVLEEGLAVAPADTDGLVVRTHPFRPPLSGDVVEAVRDGDARWVLLADVCGCGPRAAVSADRLRAAFVACATGAPGPTDVLRRLDRALRCGEEDFATALVLRARRGELVLATAGHPAPLLVPGGRVQLRPAPPLGLRVDGPWRGSSDVTLRLEPGTLAVLATDGLVDRGHEVDLDGLVAALPADLSPAALADAVLSRCEAQGPAQDDVSLAVLSSW